MVLRELIASGLGFALVFWTYRRLTGDGDDPSITASASSKSGTMSFLASGMGAIALVSGLIVVLLLPEIIAGNYTVLFVLAVVLGLHWWYERRERS